MADDEIAFAKTCWELDLPDESMYCYGAVGGEGWPLMMEDYEDAVNRDDMARDAYRRLLYAH